MIQARRIAAPAIETLSLEECYQQIHQDEIDSNGRPDDSLIMIYAAAAREYCENYTGLALALQDYEVVLTSFPDTIELPNPPFISLLGGISISDDISNNSIDEDLYIVNDFSDQYAVISAVSSWPTVGAGNRIRIPYRAGYGDESEAAGQVPASIRVAMLLMLGHYYRNREAVGDAQQQTIPLGVETLLRPYRVRRGMA